MAELLRIGAFFDGTGNNMWNDKAIEDGSQTNIAKLYDLYKRHGYKVEYEEGVGTEAYKGGSVPDGKTFSKEIVEGIRNGTINKDDQYSELDMGFALKAAKDHVESMLAKIEGIIKDNPDKEIIIDVYGFSRGAAEARDFINEVNQLYTNVDGKSVVGFVGLFDTVASIGFAADYDWKLNLNLNTDSAEQIYHITAYDEMRANFPLDSLWNDKCSNIAEYPMRGVHSDIGGGYGALDLTKTLVVEDSYGSEVFHSYDAMEEGIAELEAKVQTLEAGNSGVDYELKYEITQSIEISDSWELTSIVLEHREIEYGLSKLALKQMYDQMKATGIDLPELSSLGSVVFPGDGKSYNLWQAPKEPYDVEKYIHVSASDNWYGKTFMDWLAHREEWNLDGIRDTHYNDSKKAEIELLMLSSEDKTILYEELSDIYTVFGITDDHLSVLENYSEQFAKHRAEFLHLHLDPNERTIPEYSGIPSTVYIDQITGQKYRGDRLAGVDEIVFGSNKGEDIRLDQEWYSFLTSGNQIVYGKNGDDVIFAGEGDDTLYGGKGSDTYIFNSGDGFDTILDIDGLGSIKFDEDVLNGGECIGVDVYQSEDGKYSYKLIHHKSTKDLLINNDILIKDFESGDLGINLGKVEPYVSPSPGLYITGDHPPIEFEDGWHYDSLGNVVVNTGVIEERDDRLFGSNGNDTIQGLMGRDRIDGKGGSDVLEGGEGIDVVVGGIGDDEIHAGDAIDISALESIADFASSQNHNAKGDWLTGGLGQDMVIGSAGNDVLFGGGDEDVILGGDGNDVINGDDNYISVLNDWEVTKIETDIFDMRWHNVDIVDWSGDVGAADTIFGGAGNDYITGQLGKDLLYGETGADIIAGGGDADIIYGGAGDDKITGDYGGPLNSLEEALPDNELSLPGNDFISGGAGNDTIYGEEGDDHILGGADDDILYGDALYVDKEKHGDDRLYGNDGDDTLLGLGGDDTLFGGSGVDLLQGEDGNDYLDGGEGSDWLYGEDGDDVIFGHDGDDYMEGGEGSDYLSGDVGGDNLFGGDGDDYLYGGLGKDYICGDKGEDIVVGDAGTDYLYGGDASDTFVFSLGDGSDVIHDSDGTDTVKFYGVDPGTVKSSLVSIFDGDAFLKLQYSEQDAVYIKDGLTGGIASFDFIGYGTLSAAEFLANTLSGPIDYRLEESGSVYGSGYDDILVGSVENDAIYGHAGDDLLAGSAGDDFIDGGLGHDVYRFGIGTGIDTIVESEDKSGVLQLLPGASVYDLVYERKEDNLYIHIKDSRDGVVINDFYSGDHVWVIEDEDKETQIVQTGDVPGDGIPVYHKTIDDIRNSHIAKINGHYDAHMRISSCQKQGDESYLYIDSSPYSYATYTLGLTTLQIDVQEPYYVRDIVDSERITIRNELVEEEVVETTYPYSGTFLRKGPAAANYDFIDLDDVSLVVRGYEGKLVPVYNSNSRIDSLSGYFENGIIGYNYFSDGIPEPTTEVKTISRYYRDYRQFTNVVDIYGDSQDNNLEVGIGHYNLVDGGSGDDVLDARPRNKYGDLISEGYLTYGSSLITLIANIHGANQTLSPGSFLYGNVGDDTILGGAGMDVLVGGEGNDYMVGGMGNDTYYIYGQTGHDTILEMGADLSWDSKEDVLVMPEGVSMEDLTISWEESIHNSHHIFGRSSNGIGSNDVGWSGNVDSVHTVLKLSWSESGSVSIILPHTEQVEGTGIDYVQFHDGERVALSDLMTINGVAIDRDPHDADNVIESDGEAFYGGDGNDVISAIGDGGQLLIGGNGRDYLIGSAKGDTLVGCSLDITTGLESEHMVASLWDEGNIFRGGGGDDDIWATAGSDVFEYGLGDGKDVIEDLYHSYIYILAKSSYGYEFGSIDGPDWLYYQDDVSAREPGHLELLTSSHDTLKFDASIMPSDIKVSIVGNDLVFQHVNGQDEVRFEAWTTGDFNQLNRVEFAGDVVWGLDDINAMLNGEYENNPPTLNIPLVDMTTDEDAEFVFQIPDGTFSDPDSSDVLNLSAELSDGSPLPDWLIFNLDTNTLSGVPENSDVGSLEIRITATDSEGSTVADNFLLDIANVNDAPELVNALTDVEAVEGDSFSYIIPSDTFREIDQGDSLTYTVSLANGDSLPTWLTFDSATMTLVGDLPMDAAGNYDITIQATDQSGASVSDSFNFSVTNLVQSPTWWNRYNGTSFNDLILGSDKSEWMFGYSGNDQLVAKGGNDRLYGGAGNDILDGGAGRDLLWGGKGDDLLIGDDGNESLQSVIQNRGGYDSSGGLSSTSGWGSSGQFSSSSDDRLFGGEGNDRLQGGMGRDKLYGGYGDDVLHGGAGNDTLRGGSGNDTYLFCKNDGRDTIHNRDFDPDSSDALSFDEISFNDLLFSQHRSDLVIDVVGTKDRVTVKNWYRGEDYQLDTIETSDLVLQNDQVNQLVSAMAQFDAPSGVGSVLPQDVNDLFTPVIASS